MPERAWVSDVRSVLSDARVLRRALFTSLVVGLVLTGVRLVGGESPSALDVSLTFVVPFLVSVVSSWAAISRTRTDTRLLEREVQAINRFPDQNPHPVMRVTRDGVLSYANTASRPVVDALGLTVGGPIPVQLRTRIERLASHGDEEAFEVVAGVRTFSLLAVDVPDLGFTNVYGTDVTAAKVVERFPNRNPNPVMRMSPDGVLIYANSASAPIVRSLGIGLGDPIPSGLLSDLRAWLQDERFDIEVGGEGRTYRLEPVAVEEFDFVNVYGTDITAARWIARFPDSNPNPVLRMSYEGELVYANQASTVVRKGLGIDVGDAVPDATFTRLRDIADAGRPETVEVEADERIVALLPVWVPEFGFINVYGTDITAAREVERAHRENERLLLNILPASIAERLRAGESTIADGFEEMTVLFADVVGFTRFASRLEPREVVEVLNRVFSRFDALVEEHRLEKIKTIGDAYMVVGGLEHDPADHAERVAELGLRILEEVRAMTGEHALDLRVGMHTGPAVAGVIGIKKFIYDVWGDTVNTASRLESHGVPGRIQVSRSTYERLRDRFAFERRGEVELKGKGRVETWLVVGRSEREPSGDPRVSQPR
jgi:class 3 adenylate cyclase